MRKLLSYILMVGLLPILFASCAPEYEKVENPVPEIQKEYSDAERFTLVLKGMKLDEDRGVALHQYEIAGERDGSTFKKNLGWKKVPYDHYDKNKENLNMSILSKNGDEVIRTPHPPGYEMVGNEKYGEWREGENGNTFWHFYGQYAMFQTLVGNDHYVPRNRYRTYTQRVSTGRTYYGNGRYGTNGRYTKNRYTNRYRTAKSSNRTFSRNSWSSRSRSSVRGRSGGFGK